MHCGMLVVRGVRGIRRGWQWVEETERWLGTIPGAVFYPGVCRIHKVRIMQLRGTWSAAEAEAIQACSDLLAVHAYSAARGYYEIAEIKRLRANTTRPRSSTRRRISLVSILNPVSRTALSQGRVDAAVAGIRRALGETSDPLLRASLLPHQIDIALAAGDVETATRAADELESLAAGYKSPLMVASAHAGRGAILLAKGDPDGGLSELRTAQRKWMHLDCMYEVARARALIADALGAIGDADGALLEREIAAELFEQLGAEPDARRVRDSLGTSGSPGGLSPRELEVLRLIASGSSNKQIASDLFISENTVARHIQNIFAKLNVASRSAATSYAMKQGLI